MKNKKLTKKDIEIQTKIFELEAELKEIYGLKIKREDKK